MRIHNLYCDENGESHFRDIEVNWTKKRNASMLSEPIPVSHLVFRATSGDYETEPHPASRRQYIVNLDGGVQITASDGEVRNIGAGEVLLVEDTTGKGHISKSISSQLRHSVFVHAD